MVSAYLLILRAPIKLIAGEIFNVGYENITVSSIAKKVKKIIGQDVELVTTPTDDNRSYHISSDKILKKLGFTPRYGVEKAIKELKLAFQRKEFKNSLSNEMYFNIKRMQSLNLN